MRDEVLSPVLRACGRYFHGALLTSEPGAAHRKCGSSAATSDFSLRTVSPSEKKVRFTLIELVVVCATIALAIGVGTTTMRRSGHGKFERTVHGFQAFCAAARIQAVELGRDRVIYFNRQERRFRAGDPKETALPQEEEAIFLAGVPEDYRMDEDIQAEAEYSQPKTLADLQWTIPEDYRMNQEDDEAGWTDMTVGNEEREVFRFFSDGGASGTLKFTLQFDKFTRTFSISPLTGRMLAEEDEEK